MKRIIFRILTLVMTCLSMILIANIYDLTHIKSEVAEAKVDYIYDQDYEFINSYGYPVNWHDQSAEYLDIADKRYFFYQQFQLKCHYDDSYDPFKADVRFPTHCKDLPSDTTFIKGMKPYGDLQIAIGCDLCEEMIHGGAFLDYDIHCIEDVVGKKIQLARLSLEHLDYKLYFRDVTVVGVYRVEGKFPQYRSISGYTGETYYHSPVGMYNNNIFNETFCYSYATSYPISVVYKMPENKEDLRLEMKDDYLLRHTVDSIYYPHNDLNYESTISHLYFTLSVIGLLVTTFFALAFIFILYYDKNSAEIANLANDIEELPWFIPHIVLAIIVPIIYHIQVPWLSILQAMLFGILYLVFIYLISLCIRAIYYSRHKKIQR